MDKTGVCLILCVFSILFVCVSSVNALDISECDNQTYYLNNSQHILQSWFITNPTTLHGVDISLINANHYTLVNILTSCEVAPQSFDITVYQKLADGSTHTYYGGYLGNTTIYYYNASKNNTQIEGDENIIMPSMATDCADVSCNLDIGKPEENGFDILVDFIKINWRYFILGLVVLALIILFILLEIKSYKRRLKNE